MARKLALAFVTCGYIGYLPLAPGTWASILGCILLYLLPGVLNHPLMVLLIAVAAIYRREGKKAWRALLISVSV